MRATKIVATLGPASQSPEALGRLFDAGVDVFRCNASHGAPEDHAACIAAVRAEAARRGVHAGILLDLQGPKIRLGKFEGGSSLLKAGAEFTITTEDVPGNAARASTSYADLARDVKPGDRILLADGSIELRVRSSNGAAAVCEVVVGGPISDRKGINLPGVQVSTPSLTKKDMADLKAALAVGSGAPGIDMVALSFVRRREDVLRLRHFLEEHEARIPIVAKIEKPDAWNRLDEILDESDGVMVARGDLGVELALEKVPFIQKSIIRRARQRAKFVITATQMLETMIESPFPTRAEVSDVANAIYDGTDAVMLSAETSAGRYPVEAARMMARIATETDESLAALGAAEPAGGPTAEPSGLPAAGAANGARTAEIVAQSAFRAASTQNAAAIAVFTTTGTTARLIARCRPPMPVYAFTSSELVARQLTVLYGTRAVVAADLRSIDEMMALLDQTLTSRGWAKPGDNVVFVAGQPIGRPGTTNMLILHKIGA